jgi:hypothetical protein
LRSLVAEQAIEILMDAVYMLAEEGTANIHTVNLAPNWLDWNPEDNSAVPVKGGTQLTSRTFPLHVTTIAPIRN